MILAVCVVARLHLSASLKGSLEKPGNVSYAVCRLACLSISVSRNLSFIVYALPVHMSDQVAPTTSKTLGPFAKNGSPKGVPFGAPFWVDFRRVLDPFWSHFGSILEPILDNFGAYASLCLE